MILLISKHRVHKLKNVVLKFRNDRNVYKSVALCQKMLNWLTNLGGYSVQPLSRLNLKNMYFVFEALNLTQKHRKFKW